MLIKTIAAMTLAVLLGTTAAAVAQGWQGSNGYNSYNSYGYRSGGFERSDPTNTNGF
jgi:hypothetical protein